MKLLLIYPNSRNQVLGWGDLGAVAEPLALEYLAAGARLDGHDVCLLDLRLHPNDLDRVVSEYQPDVVGITGYSMHVRSALLIAQQIKAVLPKCAVIVGGHHATLLPEDFFEPAVDYVVSGEGVRPLRAILAALSEGSQPPAIAGVYARCGGVFVFGGASPAFRVDDLPKPDRTLTAKDRSSYFIDWMKPIALIRTTVGCPFRCSFCSLWKIMDGHYHKRDVDLVVDELRLIAEECVFLVDDEAFVDGKRMLALAQAIEAAGIHKRYFAYCRVDSFLRHRETMEAWRRIGLERLFFGIEGISAIQLAEYNKRVEVSQVEAGLAEARKLGIEIFAQFIVNTNFTSRDFVQLVRFIEHNRISYPSFTVLTPLPGTASLTTFDQIVAVQPNGRPDWDLFDCQNAVVPTRLPVDEFKREYRNLHRVFRGSYAHYLEHPPRPVRDADQMASAAPSRLYPMAPPVRTRT